LQEQLLDTRGPREKLVFTLRDGNNLPPLEYAAFTLGMDRVRAKPAAATTVALSPVQGVTDVGEPKKQKKKRTMEIDTVGEFVSLTV